MQKVLQLDPRDNVVIALRDLKQNEEIEFSGEKYSLISNVPAKHKFAAKDLTAGSQVMMYGVLVEGVAGCSAGATAEPHQCPPRGSGVARTVRRIHMDAARRRPLEGT